MPTLRPTFEAATYRRALGHVPTAVSVVTAQDDDGPVGMTVGSFTSISLDPPLVGFFADSGSSTLARITKAGNFCVNVLAEAQGELCTAFASRSEDRFAGVQLLRPDSGAIRLASALAWIECDIDSVNPIGDHVLVVGNVSALEVPSSMERPMVFFRGKTCDLDRRTVPNRGDWQRDHYVDWW